MSPRLVGELRFELESGKAATLRFFELADAIELAIVLVPAEHRGRGIGSYLVSRLLTLADAVGKPVRTTARPIGQRSPEILARLVSYYERFGFAAREHGVTTVRMERLPPAGSRPANFPARIDEPEG